MKNPNYRGATPSPTERRLQKEAKLRKEHQSAPAAEPELEENKQEGNDGKDVNDQ